MNPMRNSLLPVILVLLTLGGALLWLRASPIAEPGAEGPRFESGIFRLPKDERKLVPSADLEFSCTTPASIAAPAGMCPLEQWRVIVVHAVGRHPITAAIALALAEELTRRGSVVILATSEAPPFPMPADMSIFVEARNAPLPQTTTASHPVAVVCDWQPAYQARGDSRMDAFRDLPRELLDSQKNAVKPWGSQRLDYQVQARPGTVPRWAGWFAALGRNIAQDLIRRGSGGQALALTDPATGRWSAALLPKADWGSTLHLPPQCEGLEWHSSFQEEFVRGWVGCYRNPAASDHADLTSLERRLASGRWQRQGEARRWSREHDGVTTYFRVDADTNGQVVSCWQERPDANALVKRWLRDLVSPDAAQSALARRQLTRHQHVGLIAEDLRHEIARALGAKTSPE